MIAFGHMDRQGILSGADLPGKQKSKEVIRGRKLLV